MFAAAALARADFSPAPWSDYFDTRFFVHCATRDITFQCFFSDGRVKDSPRGAADSSLASEQTSAHTADAHASCQTADARVAPPMIATDQPVLVLFHGAGHSALSFAACAQQLRASSSSLNQPHAALPVLAFDLRGHGGTRATREDSAHFAMDELVADAIALLSTVFTAQVQHGGEVIQK
jgi:pimeloyl-ACP methyl ester carboxylesterase